MCSANYFALRGCSKVDGWLYTAVEVNTGTSDLSRREAIVTLVACALLGFDTVPSLLFGISFFTGIGSEPFLLDSALGTVADVLLGAVLLRQGGASVPSRREKGATRGALIGLAVGVVPVLLLGASPFGMLIAGALVGLAIGRTFDRSSMHRTS